MTKQELRAKWIAALRSGEYKQTTGVLYNGKGYCCLGVACKVMGLEPRYQLDAWVFENCKSVLPVEVQNAFGFNSGEGHYREPGVSLAALNDCGTTFDEIAAFVETNPKGLWRDEP